MKSTKALYEFLDGNGTGEKELFIQGAKGSYLSYILAETLKAGYGPFCIVTPTASEAEKILKDIRFFTGTGYRLLLFPPWEVLPFENMSPHPDIAGERLSTLYSLLTSEVDIVAAPPASLMQRSIDAGEINKMADYIVSGEEVHFDNFIGGLIDRGYRKSPQVEERGEFSVRGGLVDIFGPSMALPVRLEFFGDELESIREFNVDTQRSLDKKIDELVILPAHETCLSPENAGRAVRRIRTRGREMGISRERLDEILDGFDDGIFPQGIEFYLTDFHKSSSTFFEYLPENIKIIKVNEEEIIEKSAEFEAVIADSHMNAVKHEWPVPDIDELYLSSKEFQTRLMRRPSISAGGLAVDKTDIYDVETEGNDDIRLLINKSKDASPLTDLVKKIKTWRDEGIKLFFSAHAYGQGERLRDLLNPHSLDLIVKTAHPDFSASDRDLIVYIGELSHGFKDKKNSLIIITEEEIFGERHKVRGNLKKISDLQIKAFASLTRGDFIVHVDHGIGIFKSLSKISAGGTEGDYIELEYHGGDKVYVPVDRLNLVQRYAGCGGSPKIDKLGGSSWEKVKKRAQKNILALAFDLMKICAAREVMEGFAFSKSGPDYDEFAASFEYDETPDQKKAIDDTLSDMESRRPMDRLICGDVGYGKTEVAIRAAYKAVMDGKQVAVLVPTTVLARQHQLSFKDRFKGYPVIIEGLTRFGNAAKHNEIIDNLKNGKIDIVIGTHSLLRKNVEFSNLGLVVIDEEQRFGVSHKEKLKKLKKCVDVLTLSATPIPRTLHMAMTGIKDISLITSPPEGRLSIRTYIIKFDEEVIRDAVIRELRRGGQIFFVHNKVQDIDSVAAKLKKIVPEAKISIGHGQMGEKALEKIMVDFYEGRTNLLVCTTIIESGLDIPSANTIFINNANNFGLAQLYQLRGRVGRAKHRAYAYFVIPVRTVITKEAGKRLQALQEMKDLGCGFQLASHDLDIRGAGNMVGGEQSGQIDAVGYDLFTSMLNDAVMELKGREIADEIEPEIKFPCPAFLPEDYVEDMHQRLNLYKKFSLASSEDGLADLRDELMDRFGPLPETARNFIELMSFKLLLKKCMATESSVTAGSVSFLFHEKAKVRHDKILNLVKENPVKYLISPDSGLKILTDKGDWLSSLNEGKKILKAIIEYDSVDDCQ